MCQSCFRSFLGCKHKLLRGGKHYCYEEIRCPQAQPNLCRRENTKIPYYTLVRSDYNTQNKLQCPLCTGVNLPGVVVVFEQDVLQARAQQARADAQRLREQAQQLQAQADQLGTQAKNLYGQARQHGQHPSRAQQLQAQAQQLDAQAAQLGAQAQQLNQQAQRLTQQAQEHAQRARQLSQRPDA